jgi:hypothetical protein
MYLTAGTVMGAEQGKEAVQHDRPVFGDMEHLPEASHIRDRGFHWRRARCDLRSGHRRQVLA